MGVEYEYFERWYITPLLTLQSIPNGDGGFVALAMSCVLYERYADSKRIHMEREGIKISFKELFVMDFKVNEDTFDCFWKVIRDGILHQGMPMQKSHGKTLPGYIFHDSFPNPVKYGKWGNESILQIQPWRFMNKVIELCQDNFDLLVENNSFPFPKIL